MTPPSPEAPEDRLGPGFFDREVTLVARELLGCTLSNGTCGGVIVETEAYDEDDPACHAHIGRTARNAGLLGPPGQAYVYLSYGIHRLFNVVTGPQGTAAAVLVRALQPRWDLDSIRARRPGRTERELCAGPGRLALALAIGAEHDGADLATGALRLGPPSQRPDRETRPIAGPRIGISKGTELPWRYCARGAERWLSAPPG